MGKDFFKDRQFVIEYLARALSEHRLAIFLGAGVSRSLINTGPAAIGLPTWQELLLRLYKGQRWVPPSGNNYTQQAEDFKNRFLKLGKTQSDLIKAVSNALYQGFDEKKLDFAVIRENATLSAVAALIAHSRRGRVNEVFTLNFDDIVERYLRYQGIIAKPIVEERHWAEATDIAIYHPHGFLPSPGSPFRNPSKSLVFDENSYLKQHDDNRWNRRMQVAMQSHVCLFVGLGRDDLHLKHLVDKSLKEHAYSPTKDGYWGIVLRAKPKSAEINDWATYDVFVQLIKDYQRDLPLFLFSVCQEAAKMV